MDIKTKPGIHHEHEVIAVPSHEGGAFIVQHGEYYGPRVYTEMELIVSEEQRAQVVAGDTSSVEPLITANPERPGFYTLVEGIGRVTTTVAGSPNTTSNPVSEVLEVMPVAPVVD